jgi:osmoprotectant transport system permease protein
MTTLTQYLLEYPDRVWPRFVEHLTLSVSALLIAVVISLPLGLLLNRIKPLRDPVLFVLDMFYTIPSFALFALLVPIMGLGPEPAIVALIVYSLFILVRNTMVGYDGVDPAVKEAAWGMGMSRRQVLWRIETPLAFPVILAGIRIATLSTVGLATIAAWIGAGGLGSLLRDGLGGIDLPFNQSKLYAGLICIGAIALGADLLFRFIERRVAVPSG